MKKETSTYILNITKSEYFLIDLLNLFLGMAILVFSVIAFINGKMESFGIVFILGAILSILNLIKTIMRKSFIGIALFSGLTVGMFVMIAVLYGYFL